MDVQITGRPNLGLHKHRRKCPGLPDAWMNRQPGSIPPNEDPVLAAERHKQLRTLLVGAVVSKNLPFSIFEGDLMQAALRAICPGFRFPGQMTIKHRVRVVFARRRARTTSLSASKGVGVRLSTSKAYTDTVQESMFMFLVVTVLERKESLF